MQDTNQRQTRERGKGPRDRRGLWQSTASQEEDALIVALYDEGNSIEIVAEMTYRSMSFIHGRLKALDIKRRNQGGSFLRLTNNDMVVTKGLYERGYTLEEIGKILGRTYATIAYRLEAYGVPRRTRSEAQKASWARRKRKAARASGPLKD